LIHFYKRYTMVLTRQEAPQVSDSADYDVLIRCDSVGFFTHRVMLAASSNFMREVLQDSINGQDIDEHVTIFLPDCQPEDVENLLSMLYNRDNELDRARVLSSEVVTLLGIGTFPKEVALLSTKCEPLSLEPQESQSDGNNIQVSLSTEKSVENSAKVLTKKNDYTYSAYKSLLDDKEEFIDILNDINIEFDDAESESNMEEIEVDNHDKTCTLCSEMNVPCLFNHSLETLEPSPSPCVDEQSMQTMQSDNSGVTVNCEFCSEHFDSKKNLEIHVKKEHMGHFLKCPKCNEEFWLEKQLEAHLKDHDYAENPLQCQLCSSTFTTKQNLDDHRTNLNCLKTFKCDQCDTAFRKETYLIKHRETHNEIKMYKCDYCQKMFKSRCSAIKHSKTHENLVQLFPRDDCGKAFREETNLIKHRKTHNEIEMYKCDYCQKTFKSRSRAIVHKKNHEGEFDYRCQYCAKGYNNRHTLKVHEEHIHQGIKAYECNQCDKKLSTNASLKVHIQRKHEPPKDKPSFICEICSRGFQFSRDLSCHRANHLVGKRYFCDICNRGFEWKTYLRVHKRRAHTGEKPHKCTQCSKAFVTLGALNCHKKSHSSHRPFKCDICTTKAYKYNWELRKHLRKIHGKKIN